MMQAMNTGHEGSISTVHANTPRDALARIENMILMANLDLPSRAIREQIASAVHIIMQIARMSDGSRKLTHLSEITGMEGQVITMQDIFRFEQTGVDSEGRVLGAFKSTGIRPKFAERFESQGIELRQGIFSGMVAA
jgi:pilus assembly protein CpaF